MRRYPTFDQQDDPLCQMAQSKFDKPASVTWSTTGPGGKPLPANTRDFHTLREAIQYVRTLPHGARERTTVRSAGKSYAPAEIERLEIEMRRR
jgi:hypothetical protein